MFSIRKWLYKPKKTDTSLLAQFYYADEDLNVIATELDSFDGRKDPERCTALVNQLRACQDKVLNIIQKIMDDAITGMRANRDFRVKFPDDVVHENLSGQLWFGAECLAAGSSIMNREIESAGMRPLARALTRTLDNLRGMLREQCLRSINSYTDKIRDALGMFDQLFAEFELSYVSAMVPVKTMKEYDAMQDVIVLFSETVERAMKCGLLSQEMIDDYDPALMFTIPRLAIVSGLLIFPDGPLNPDNDAASMTEMFRPFQTLLFKIRQLLWTLSEEELYMLEKALCNAQEPGPFQPLTYPDQSPCHKMVDDTKQTCDTKKMTTSKMEDDDSDSYSGGMSQSASANTIICNPEYTNEGAASWNGVIKHQDSKDSGTCDHHQAMSHESLQPGDHTASFDGSNTGDDCSSAADHGSHIRSSPQCTGLKVDSSGARVSPDSNRISPIEEMMSESSHCSGDDGVCNNEDTMNAQISSSIENTKDEGPLIQNDESLGQIPMKYEVVVTTESKTMDRESVEIHHPPTDGVKKEEVCSPSAQAMDSTTMDNSLLHIEVTETSSLFSSGNTSPSKSEAYSELASESDSYFDATETDFTNTVVPPQSTEQDQRMPENEDVTFENSVESQADVVPDQPDNPEPKQQETGQLAMDVNHFKDKQVKAEGNNHTAPIPKMKSGKGSHDIIKSSKEGFYRRRVKDFVSSTGEESNRRHGQKYPESVTSSSCSTCASDSDWDCESCDTTDTSSYNSDCHDDEEIALAIQAAELASRNEARSRFRSSSDLIHRLFVCVSGVADQLQTNYASDLRNILRGVFDIHSTEPIIRIEHPKKSGGPPPPLRGRMPLGRHNYQVEPPTWVPDDESPHCSSCKMLFTLVRRRHHCRNCGKIFCSRCSANFVPLPHFGHTKPVRVCNHCFMFQVTPFTVDETS